MKKNCKLKKLIIIAMALIQALFLISCSDVVNNISTNEVETTNNKLVVNVEKKYNPLTIEFIDLMKNEENKNLMIESLNKAKEIVPNKKYNPVQTLDELYDFLDIKLTAMPWNIFVNEKYPDLYDKIDQSLNYFYYIFDQPLPELENKGYYYPSLSYHEPFSSFIIKYVKEYGKFLETEESWNDEYYNIVCQDEKFGMSKGWYADTNIYKTFNEFFSRHLSSPDQRPIASSEVVAPADSAPQGVWKIADNGDIIKNENEEVIVKTKQIANVNDLLARDSKYFNEFNGGTFTHTFLDVNDYHRYHFPVDGTIVEVKKIPALDAIGGITVWDEEIKRYLLKDNVPGWQMVETRDCVILDTKDYGLVAVLPIAMSQVSSCNFEKEIVVGKEVKKGDPLGYFLFGGSDIIMMFQKNVEVEYLPQENSHILMGEAYINLKK